MTDPKYHASMLNRSLPNAVSLVHKASLTTSEFHGTFSSKVAGFNLYQRPVDWYYCNYYAAKIWTENVVLNLCYEGRRRLLKRFPSNDF